MFRQISFQDARLDQVTAGSMDAWVSIGPDALSLLVTDGTGAVQGAVYIPVQPGDVGSVGAMASLVQSNFLFSLRYKRRRGCLFSEACTLVPSRLFQPDAAAAYFRLLTPDPGTSFGHASIDEYAATAVYGFSEADLAIWNLMDLEQEPRHAMTVFLRIAWAYCAGFPQAAMVHVRGTSAQFAFMAGRRLLYAHTERFQTNEDLVYHIRMLFTELKFPADRAPLFVSGTLHEPLTALLTTYLGNVQPTPVHQVFRFPALQTPIPASLFMEAMAMAADLHNNQ